MLTLTLYQKKKKRVGGNSFQLRAQAWFVSRWSRSLYWVISSRDIRGGTVWANETEEFYWR